MRYHDISLVSIFGLHGTLYVQKTENEEGVSVQAEGPYEAKVADDSWLRIYPEGQEPPITRPFVFRRSRADITAGGMHLGSVDVAAKLQFLTSSGPRIRARASARVEPTVRVTAPLSTKFELIRCYGVCKGPRGWHLMRGNSRFDTRWTQINEAPPACGIS